MSKLSNILRFHLLGFWLGLLFWVFVWAWCGVLGFPLASWQWGVRTGWLVCIVCSPAGLVFP